MLHSRRMIQWFLGGALLASTAAFGAVDPMDKVSDALKQEMVGKVSAELSAVVIFKEQADLTRAGDFRFREQKGRFVYNTLVEVAKRTQQPLVDWLNERSIEHQRFYVTNMIALYGADPKTIAAVASRDEVEKVLSNQVMQTLPIIQKDASLAGEEAGVVPGVVSIGAKKVWDEFGFDGAGIVVAGQDTGIRWDHVALKGKYRGWNNGAAEHNFNWHDAIRSKIGGGTNACGLATKEPCDDHDHGTHTIGTVVGDDGAGNQIGVAPGAEWIGCRNMDEGNGRPTTYIECFEWFLAPYPYGGNPMSDGRPEMAPHVINNSWGCPPSEGCKDAETLPVLESLMAAGIMVVASAGNEGSSCETIEAPPAMHSATTLSVGAHDHRNGTIAGFSSRGPSKFDGEVGPDITAPGVRIRSAVKNGGYSETFWSGTSMAGPHVVGAVALLWQADPSLIGQIEETIDVLRSTADGQTSTQTCGGVDGNSVPNNTFGYGHVNIYEAIRSRMVKAQ